MVCDLTNFCQDDFIFDLENSLFEFDTNLAAEQINSHNFNGVFQGFIEIIRNVLNTQCPNKLIYQKKKQIEQEALDNKRHLKFDA